MANVFIHFEPIGPIGSPDVQEGSMDLPPYILPGSPEEENWRASHPNGHTIMTAQTVEIGATEAHRAAMDKDLHELKIIVDAHEEVVNAVDVNGWTPLHEGVRAGNAEIVKFLIERGSNVNARTEGGRGGSALWWAMEEHGEENDVVELLKAHGAKHIAPNVKDEL